MVTVTGFIWICASIILGLAVGVLISKRKEKKKSKKYEEILKDPVALAERLNANGPLYDQGKKIEFKVKNGELISEEVEVKKNPIKKIEDKIKKSTKKVKKELQIK